MVRSPARRGAAFVVTLLVISVMVAMALTFARQMRTEALAASNHVAMVEARWLARGVLETVRGELARTRALYGTPRLDTIGVAAEPVGGGLYWLIRPGFEDDRAHAYGLCGESGKMNLNVAPAVSLVELPGMSEDLAAAMVDWRDADDELTPGGAESEHYLAQPEPYQARNGAFETVEELLLVRDVTSQLVYGEDVNRSGVMEAGEDDGDGRLQRGLYDLVTVYSLEPADDRRVNINRPGAELVDLLRTTLSEARYAQVLGLIAAQRPYRNTLDFFVRAKLAEQEFEALHERITTGGPQARRGLVDVSRAPPAVLDALAGLDVGDGALIVAARPEPLAGEAPASLAWLVDVLGAEKAVAVAGQLTHRSFQFTADIVAVTGDGRGFCRLRAVIDANSADDTVLSPVRYVQDLTSLGWPLDPAIRDELRRGAATEDVAAVHGATPR